MFLYRKQAFLLNIKQQGPVTSPALVVLCGDDYWAMIIFLVTASWPLTIKL